MNREYFELFVDKSKDYYLEFLDDYEQGEKFRFNLMPFLFGIFWFLYRKMYIESFILFLIILTESVIERFIIAQAELTNTQPAIGIQLITTLIITVTLGYLGNWIYIKHANRKIRSITEKYHLDEIILKDKIQKQGGTSILVIVIMLTIIISLIVISKT